MKRFCPAFLALLCLIGIVLGCYLGINQALSPRFAEGPLPPFKGAKIAFSFGERDADRTVVIKKGEVVSITLESIDLVRGVVWTMVKDPGDACEFATDGWRPTHHSAGSTWKAVWNLKAVKTGTCDFVVEQRGGKQRIGSPFHLQVRVE